MIPIVIIEGLSPAIKMIKIFKPKRGIGGTMAFPININGFDDILEMNEEGIWVATNKIKSCTTAYITHVLNELLETTIVPLVLAERKNKDPFDYTNRFPQKNFISFSRFSDNETYPKITIRL